MNLRPIILKDASEVFALERAAYPKFPWSLENIESEILGPLSWAIAAIIDGEIIGYYFARDLGDEIHLCNLVVSTRYQHRSFGKLLLETLIERAKSANKIKIWLEVRSHNVAAINLYKSLEFVIDFESPQLYPTGSAKDRQGMRMSLVFKSRLI